MRILCALSGGVDSAVAASRLLRDGAEVVGVHYRTGAVADDARAPATGRSCCGVDDARDARAVAARLGVPFYVVDVSEAFGRDVIDAFVESYAAGRTPNPCIACNRSVKFGRLLDLADGLGAEAVATGHYARTVPRPGGGVRLLRPADRRKDQTYVLHSIDPARLVRARFPLGDATKDAVRAEARALGLSVADKPDSQELCFVPDGDHRAELARRAPGLAKEGPILAEDGRELGRHTGAAGFTVGQRRGVGVASAAPLHVLAVDPARNTIVVGPRERLAQRTIRTARFHLLDELPAADPVTGFVPVTVRIRHAMEPVPARLALSSDGTALVEGVEPFFAPAPGQALVAYDGDVVLGGAPIDSAGEAAVRPSP